MPTTPGKAQAPALTPRSPTKVKLDAAGRLLIPAELRKALGVQPGEYLIMSVEDGDLRAWTFAQGVRRAREVVAKHVPPDVSLVDELIAERRGEAALEELGPEEARRSRAGEQS